MGSEANPALASLLGAGRQLLCSPTNPPRCSPAGTHSAVTNRSQGKRGVGGYRLPISSARSRGHKTKGTGDLTVSSVRVVQLGTSYRRQGGRQNTVCELPVADWAEGRRPQRGTRLFFPRPGPYVVRWLDEVAHGWLVGHWLKARNPVPKVSCSTCCSVSVIVGADSCGSRCRSYMLSMIEIWFAIDVY
jgi:hypothetical protein